MDLCDHARAVRDNAHAPYSRFKVGAAIRTVSGAVFTGCNVENLSYGLTICAERVAIGSAVAAGARHFTCVAVVADTSEPVSPCGACRQVMAEFSVPRVVLANRAGSVGVTLADLLPRATTGILDRPGGET